MTVVGTPIGALTREDGAFTLTRVPDGSHRVQASMVGYAPQQQAVTVASGASVTADFALQAQAVARRDRLHRLRQG